MTTPMRKLIRAMIPSARTPTTSKRWTTAFTRKRLGRRMTLPKPIRVAPKKPIRPTSVVPVSAIHLPSSANTEAMLCGTSGTTRVGTSNSPTCFSRLTSSRLAPIDLGTTVADGPIDDPGPDRVHPVDIAEVDRQRVGEPVDLTLGGCGAGDGERPGDPVARAVPLVVVVLRHLGHRGTSARNG